MDGDYLLGQRVRLLTAERRLLIDGHRADVGSRAFEILRILVGHPGQIVSLATLLEDAWAGRVVEPANVHVQVSNLRALLGRDAIATVRGGGYQLRLPVVQDENRVSAVPRACDDIERRPLAVTPYACEADAPPLRAMTRAVTQDMVTGLVANADLRVRLDPVCGGVDGTGPRYCVQGQIGERDGTVFVETRLVDTRHQLIVGSLRSEGALDAAGLSRYVARACGLVHNRSLTAECQRLRAGPLDDADPSALVWRALALVTEFRGDSFLQARTLLHQATSLNPVHAAAWAWLACMNSWDAAMRITTADRPRDYEGCMALAERALVQNSSSPIAYRALSVAHRLQRDHAAALSAAHSSVALAPSCPHCHHIVAEVLCAMGDAAGALVASQHALDLDSRASAWVLQSHAAALWMNHRVDEALAAAQQCLNHMPSYWFGRMFRMYALMESGQPGAAREEAQRLMARLPGLTVNGLLGYWSADAGDARRRAQAAALAAGIPAGRRASAHVVREPMQN